MQPWEQFQQAAPTQSAKQPWEQFGGQADANPGFLDRVGTDFNNRIQMGANAINDYKQGKQTALETGLQATGKGIAGFAGDLAGETAKGLFNTAIPESDPVRKVVGAGLDKVGNYIANSPVGVAGGEAINQYKDWAAAHPRASNNIDAVTDIGAAVPLAKPAVAIADNVGNIVKAMGEGSGVSTNIASLGAAPLLGKTLGESATDIKNAFIDKNNLLSGDQIKDIAGRSFNAADAAGGVLAPQETNSLISKVSNIGPQTTEGMSFAGNNAVTNTIADFKNLANKPLTLKGAAEIDQELGQRIESAVNPATGKTTAEGRVLSQMQQAFRQHLEDAGNSGALIGGPDGVDAWREGQKLWSASMRANDIERIINRANMTDNPATALRTGFKNLATNPARLRGYTADEVKAINYAANTGALTGALKFAGSRLISSVTGAAGGAAGGGVLGAAVGAGAGAAVGTPLRAAASALQEGRGNAVLEAIGNRADIQQAITPQNIPNPQQVTVAQISKMPPSQARQVLNALMKAKQKP